eukprot:Lithocolla_globosa_v1_NODE_560_length_3748_cov_17.769022.p2 type:complete len:373 gc:universal NODE_560_length_3748_cov_17.769022:3442-2324(-)
MLSCVGKFVSMVWWARLEEMVEPLLRDGQSGFRKRRSVRDVWWVLEGMLRNREGKGYVALVDYRKAFDRVWRDGLWMKLHKKGVRGKMWRMVMKWYEGSQEWLGVETEWIEIDIGVKQGCVLSGLLFAGYMDDLFECLEEVGRSMRASKGEGEEDLEVAGLMYADDLTMLPEDEEGMEGMMMALAKWCRKWRMTINEEKSEVVVFRQKGIERKKGWSAGGMKLKEKEWSKCVGVEMEKMLGLGRYRKRIMRKAGGLIWPLRRIVWVLGERGAVAAWMSFVKSVLLFGNEVMVWDTKKVREGMDVIQRRVWCAVFGLERGASSDLLYGEMDEMRLSSQSEVMVEKYETAVEGRDTGEGSDKGGRGMFLSSEKG